jgi:hypothetical protein
MHFKVANDWQQPLCSIMRVAEDGPAKVLLDVLISRELFASLDTFALFQDFLLSALDAVGGAVQHAHAPQRGHGAGCLQEGFEAFHLHQRSNDRVLCVVQVATRDFYNVRKVMRTRCCVGWDGVALTPAHTVMTEKVDTHIHHSAIMNQKHLLKFIKTKLRTEGDVTVLFRDNKASRVLIIAVSSCSARLFVLFSFSVLTLRRFLSITWLLSLAALHAARGVWFFGVDWKQLVRWHAGRACG